MKTLIQKIIQCELNQASTTLGSALLAAAVILAVSWLSRDSTNAEAIFLITLTTTTSIVLLVDQNKKNQSN